MRATESRTKWTKSLRMKITANGARARISHQYVQIPSHCPRCKQPLTIQQPVTLEDELPSETRTSIFCSQCGYGSGAVYQLVDIQKNKYDAEFGREAYRSEVGTERSIPSTISISSRFTARTRELQAALDRQRATDRCEKSNLM